MRVASAIAQPKAAPAAEVRTQPQKRRARGLSGVSSTESASPAELPPVPHSHDDADRQTDPAVNDEARLQEVPPWLT